MVNDIAKRLETLAGLYKSIGILSSEINDLNRSYEHVQQLESSIIGKELETHLNAISVIFVNDLNSRKKERREKSNSFEELMYATFGIRIAFEDDSLVCKSDKVNDPGLVEYKNTLTTYIELFNSVGIDDEDVLVKIKEDIHDMLSIALKLFGFCKLLKQSRFEFLEKINILSMLSKQIEEYKVLIYNYKEFLKDLVMNGEIPFSESNIQYIIRNTSLMPLVFANNSHPLIRGVNSLRRLFLCQYHQEKTPSMRVDLEKNYFKCFGCGWNGNQIDYLSQMHNISYTEAVYLLAEIFLIDLPDNPFRAEEKASLVERYREVLVSEKYNTFLADSMNRVCKNNLGYEKVYLRLFSQIERVKSGTWDYSFEFESKTARFLNYSSDEAAVKRLLPEETFSGFLSF